MRPFLTLLQPAGHSEEIVLVLLVPVVPVQLLEGGRCEAAPQGVLRQTRLRGQLDQVRPLSLTAKKLIDKFIIGNSFLLSHVR